MTQQDIQYPQQAEQIFPYSVKIEQSSKGARVSVHCYNNNIELVAREVVETYLKVRRDLKELGCQLAPEE